ncbi:MAG: hypothetical protein ACJ8R9_05500 [Steroidobacteraceae bacterium]
MRPWILATDGRPFPSWKAASERRDELAAELGPSVSPEVIPHPEGGFAVSCPEPSPATALTRSGIRAARVPLSQSMAIRAQSVLPFPDRCRIGPAWRASWGQLLLALLGTYLALVPRDVFRVLHLALPTSALLEEVATESVALAGVALIVLSALRYVWYPISNAYQMDARGVTKILWCWEGVSLRRYAWQMDFQQIRSVQVAQTLSDRLLGLGALILIPHRAMEQEVRLCDLAVPNAVRAEIVRRILVAPARGGQLREHSAGHS